MHILEKLTTKRKCDRLMELCRINEQTANSLLKLVEPKQTTAHNFIREFDDFKEQLKPLLRSRLPQVSQLAKVALEEITQTTELLRHFGGMKFFIILKNF